MTPANTRFAAWLDASDYTVAELARLLGVTAQAVYQWRNGSPPSLENAVRIEKLSLGAVKCKSWGAR